MLKNRFVFFYAFFCFILVILFIIYGKSLDKKEDEQNIPKKVNEKTEEIKIDTGQKIKVKITDTGEIREMTVNEYLVGVLPAEMPPDYEEEALKAQAVVARTYLYQKMSNNSHKDVDICDNPSHCQAYYSYNKLMNAWEKTKHYDKQTRSKYYEKIKKVVKDTENIVVTYDGEYIKAFFHACSAGKTEDVSAIWGEVEIPYLKAVESIEDKNYKNYSSQVKLTKKQIVDKINEKLDKKCSNKNETKDFIKIVEYTKSGRVKYIEIGGEKYKATELRTALDLRSTNFTIEEDTEKIIFNVKGNGHGVGMSQVGADYLAKEGKNYEDIIKHYYTGVNLEKI